MKFHTQLRAMSCWQTAVACVLNIELDELPEQAGPKGYGDPLNACLVKHHGLCYVEVYRPVIDVVGPPEFHVLVGPTVRTPLTRVNHAVAARRGEMVWDPHPSRSGLTAVHAWGLITHVPAGWRSKWEKMECACRACREEK